jgi:hypothetical protein
MYKAGDLVKWRISYEVNIRPRDNFSTTDAPIEIIRIGSSLFLASIATVIDAEWLHDFIEDIR